VNKSTKRQVGGERKGTQTGKKKKAMRQKGKANQMTEPQTEVFNFQRQKKKHNWGRRKSLGASGFGGGQCRSQEENAVRVGTNEQEKQGLEPTRGANRGLGGGKIKGKGSSFAGRITEGEKRKKKGL